MNTIFVGVLLIFSALYAAGHEEHLLHAARKRVEEINNSNLTWKASDKFIRYYNYKDLNVLMGARLDKMENYEVVLRSVKVKQSLPKHFDARKKWPYCKSIGAIMAQGECGACWAVASANIFSDRLCIGTRGRFREQLSIRDVLSCCKKCGAGGCKGGWPILAWQYFEDYGIPTGGFYRSRKGCLPYPIPPLEVNETPKCLHQCHGGSKPRHAYKHDKHFANRSYIISKNEQQIMHEIFTNGPVVGILMVKEDFRYYSEGIYQDIENSPEIGGHALKLIGWGVQDGIKYWLGVNSWGSQWGENGLFKILRGKNLCGIEEMVTAGIPRLERHHQDHHHHHHHHHHHQGHYHQDPYHHHQDPYHHHQDPDWRRRQYHQRDRRRRRPARWETEYYDNSYDDNSYEDDMWR